MDNFRDLICDKKLSDIVNCLVVEIDNTIQVVKNKNGYLKFNEVKDLKFIRVTKDDIKYCNNVSKAYQGKNVWYIDNPSETNEVKLDNIVKVNGNNFTDYDKAIDYITKLKDREIASWFFHDVDLYGIGYAILKWCQSNNKYYNEKILKAALDEYSVRAHMIGSNFANDVLKIYNKNLELDQYRGKRYEGLVR